MKTCRKGKGITSASKMLSVRLFKQVIINQYLRTSHVLGVTPNYIPSPRCTDWLNKNLEATVRF